MQPTGSIYSTRQAKLTTGLQTSGINALILNPGSSLSYLTGLHFHLSERPVVTIFIPHNPLIIILPGLEAPKLKSLDYPMQAFTYGDDPQSWPGAFRGALQAIDLAPGAILGVEPRQLRFLEHKLLETGLSEDVDFVSAGETLSALRMYKDEDELKNMRTAVDIAQKALQDTLPAIQIGVTEKEIAAELTLHILRHGSLPELPFFPIVSGGPNSANPHAAPSDRPLQPGDLLVIDWGANFNSYMSDITRTFAIGEIEPEFEKIHDIVLEANTAGREAARPGISAGEVDAVTRNVIESAGYGEYFTHRTGHGLGMEVHEEPYIYRENPMPLSPGMTFTIEPGVYLPGQNGIRIEDNIAVTENGAESLTDISRDLIVIG